MRAGALAALAVGAVLLTAPAAEAAGPPLIAETWVEEVKADSVRLRAKINPEGAATTYRFEITPQASFEEKGFTGATLIPVSGPVGLGSGSSSLLVAQPVGPPLTPLQAATAYRYRVTAKHTSEAEVIGADHLFSTQGSELSFHLPDSRAWELVSPVDKGGGAIAPPETLFGGGDLQASPSSAASSITYGSSTSFSGAGGAPPVSQYLSQRTSSGWQAQNVSAPLESAAYGDNPDGAPYRLFSQDLSAGLLFGGLPCRGALAGCPAPNPVLAGSGAPQGFMAYYLRSPAGTYSSLLDPGDLLHTAVGKEAFSVSFAGASPDLAHVILSSCSALMSNATEVPNGSGGCEAADQNLYEASGGSLTAISLLPGETQTTPETGPTKLAAPIGAISSDGSRVYFSAAAGLYLRDGSQTKEVSGSGQFQTASTDGSVAFFTEEVSGSQHLFLYLAQTQAKTDLTPSGQVAGVLGASAEGTVVYYQDATGIHKWASGTTTLVAAGAEAAKPSDYLLPPATATSRVTPGGSHLAFLSTKELAAYDNAGRAELYLYGPPVAGGAAQLLCASCNPTGEKAAGFASIPGTQANGSALAYRPRVLSADGHRVFFDSTDKLSIADTNGQPDVYQWEARERAAARSSPVAWVRFQAAGRPQDAPSSTQRPTAPTPTSSPASR